MSVNVKSRQIKGGFLIKCVQGIGKFERKGLDSTYPLLEIQTCFFSGSGESSQEILTRLDPLIFEILFLDQEILILEILFPEISDLDQEILAFERGT